MSDIHGHCDAKFQRVADAFENCFTEHGDVGASVCFTVEGQKVVDLWSGFKDHESEAPWQEDTLSFVFSASKGPVATAIHVLAERGLLEIDSPVANYWPEYAQNGKDAITVRQVMAHTAGVPFIDAKLPEGAGYDWEAVIKACESQAPEWTPGAQLAYHSVTFGFILGEVIRRVSGLSPGQFIHKEIAGPLGADFFIGLPPSEHLRVATLIPPSETDQPKDEAAKPKPFSRAGSFLMLPDKPWGSREMKTAEIPAVNGISNARGSATFYRPLALDGEFDGVRVLSQKTINEAIELQAAGPDPVLEIDNAKRAVGYKLMWPEMGVEFGEKAFGHPGFGGQFGVADPEKRMSFGYVTTKLWEGPRGTDPRGSSLAAAAYDSLN